MRRTTPVAWLVLFAALVALGVPSLASARAWLGVYTQEVTRDLRDALDLAGEGALIARVVPGSPADRAGLGKGDVIVSVDRRDVRSPSDLTRLIEDARVGDSVSLTLVRRGDRRIIAVRLGERPGDEGEISAPPTPRAPRSPRAPAAPRAPRGEMRWHSIDDHDKDVIRERVREVLPDFEFDGGPGRRMAWMGEPGRGRLGVRIETLGDDLAAALGASGVRGVLVVEVLDETPAEKAGLRAGDIITAVKGTSVSDADALVKALRNESGTVPVSIVRRGEKRTVEADLGSAPRVIRLREGNAPGLHGPMGDHEKFDIRVEKDAAAEDLRRELQELREQLRELRRELQERRR